MTNAMIIFNESMKLMENGVLKGSGTFAQIENEDGTTAWVELPEEIHTFNGWKERGYSVKKGEKAIAKFPIWKYTEKQKTDEEMTGNPIEDAPTSRMFMKTSAFFAINQVERTKTNYLPAPKKQLKPANA